MYYRLHWNCILSSEHTIREEFLALWVNTVTVAEVIWSDNLGQEEKLFWICLSSQYELFDDALTDIEIF